MSSLCSGGITRDGLTFTLSRHLQGYLSSSTGCVRSARRDAWTGPLFAGTRREVKEWVELDLLALMLVVLPCVALVPFTQALFSTRHHSDRTE